MTSPGGTPHAPDRAHRAHRARWAALGAAVAVTLGAGGLATVDATSSSGERTVFVPVTPCRLVDTRPTSTVGTRSRPLGADDTHVVAARGERGECDLPADASALALNVTAVGASAPTFLTVFPDGAARPDASNLNPQPGDGPAPNSATTDLSDAGRFSIYNRQGVVDVIVDVTGYYVDHDHDDRYYTKAQSDDRTAGDVIAMGFVNATGATPVVNEQRTAAGVSIALSSPSAGRVDLVVTGADTGDAPMISVTPHSIDGTPRTCNTRSLSIGPGSVTWNARIECYNAAGVAAANTSFTFVVTD